MLAKFVPAMAAFTNLIEDVDTLKGEIPKKKIVEENSKRPDVSLTVIGVA